MFCDVPDYGCHGWLRGTCVCPGHLTAMFALTHLVLLAHCIAVLGVGDDTAAQTPEEPQKGRLTWFCSTKWQREKGSLNCVPGEV